jgi:hypothetical protein
MLETLQTPLFPDDGEVAARAIAIENTGRVRKSA